MIKIEKAKVEDIAQIQEVYYRSWLATYPNEKVGITVEDVEENFKDRFSEERMEKRKREISDDPGKSLFLVAKDDDMAVGVLKLVKEYNGRSELGSIYVLPEFQRLGIGMMLWNGADGFFEDKEEVFVRVADYNQKAISFYEKLGFVDTGRRLAEEKYRMPISGVMIPEMEMRMVFGKK